MIIELPDPESTRCTRRGSSRVFWRGYTPSQLRNLRHELMQYAGSASVLRFAGHVNRQIESLAGQLLANGVHVERTVCNSDYLEPLDLGPNKDKLDAEIDGALARLDAINANLKKQKMLNGVTEYEPDFTPDSLDLNYIEPA